MILLTPDPIDAAAVLAQVGSHNAGGVVLFLGTVRAITGDQRTTHLEYECYADMAVKKLAELEAEARRRWPIIGCALVHRYGSLAPGEASVAVAVSTPHRAEAFAAAQWLIDTLKQTVPIWKKEHFSDRPAEWVGLQ
jgi:molybdopterin synthase catalytic subunit